MDLLLILAYVAICYGAFKLFIPVNAYTLLTAASLTPGAGRRIRTEIGQSKAFGVNSRRLSGWKTTQKASGRRSKPKSVGFYCHFGRETKQTITMQALKAFDKSALLIDAPTLEPF